MTRPVCATFLWVLVTKCGPCPQRLYCAHLAYQAAQFCWSQVSIDTTEDRNGNHHVAQDAPQIVKSVDPNWIQNTLAGAVSTLYPRQIHIQFLGLVRAVRVITLQRLPIILPPPQTNTRDSAESQRNSYCSTAQEQG